MQNDQGIDGTHPSVTRYVARHLLLRIGCSETNGGLQGSKRIAGRDGGLRIGELLRLNATGVAGQCAQPELAISIRHGARRRPPLQHHGHVGNRHVAAVVTDLTSHGKRVRRGMRKSRGHEKQENR